MEFAHAVNRPYAFAVTLGYQAITEMVNTIKETGKEKVMIQMKHTSEFLVIP